MSTFTGGQAYAITSVSFGIEQATSGSGTGQPVTVNLYTNSGTPFPGGTRTLLATSGSINIPDQSLTVFNVPITAKVPAGTLELVMEVTNPDGVAARQYVLYRFECVTRNRTKLFECGRLRYRRSNDYRRDRFPEHAHCV